ISELTRETNAKLVELALFRNILSPVRRVPLKILSEIFVLVCSPEHGIFMPFDDIIKDTCVISGVCVAWRKAAHATPRLW
ncbi:hypothetical protein BT96DRAFT_757706, partial [Gymnopus androsaceus JB14]